MRRIGLVLGVLLLGTVFASPAHNGLWPDEIVFIEEADQITALSMMQSGDAQLFATPFLPELLGDIWMSTNGTTNESDGGWEWANLAVSYGSFDEILLNPAVDDANEPFFSDGRFNPFAIPEVRQAMSYLIDRDFIVEEILSGLAVARWTVLDPFFFPYVGALDACRAIELEYAYDEAKAWELISEAMESAGADLGGDKWTYNEEPVTIVGLIPVEDERRYVGEYIANLLEQMGFTVECLGVAERTAAQRWLLSDPYDGAWSFYVAQWTKPSVDRDQADDFDALYTSRGAPVPLNWSYQCLPDPHLEEADDVFDRLARRDYETIAERVELLGLAETYAAEKAWHQWLYSEAATWAWPTNVSVLVDIAAGITGSYLWGHTLRYVDADGAPIDYGTICVASPSMLSGPWNPVAGSTATSDRMIQRAAEDWFLYPDPNTGLFLPHLVEYAECYVLYGTPMVPTHDYVIIVPVDGIEVPPEAWCDWDAANQVFIPVCEKFPDGLTARTRTVCTFADDLFENTWHDGSSFSLADMLMRFIMTFDVGKSESPIFDEAQVPLLEQFLQTFKGARILNVYPLVIEVYDDRFCLDAENQVFERIGQLFWPYYGSGMAPWHTLAVGVQAEADGLTCFSEVKADQLGVDRQNWIAGPTLETLMDYAREALSESRIPYEPTLGEYVSSDEAFERYVNLDNFLRDYNHMWISNGPMRIYEVDPTNRIIVGTRFEDYRHDAYKWLELSTPRFGNMEVDGSDVVRAGNDAVFDVSLTFEGEPYPANEIQSVKYLVIDATGELALSGTGVVLGDGQLRVTVPGTDTDTLPAGSWKIEVITVLIPVATPSFASIEFQLLSDGAPAGVSKSEAIDILTAEVIRPESLDHDVIAFTLTVPLQPGDRIAPYLPYPLPEDVEEAPHLTERVIEESAWFFWIDDSPKGAFEHKTRFVLIDAETGEATVTQERWWALLNGEPLWVETEEYWNPENWAFHRFEFTPPYTSSAAPAGEPSPATTTPTRPSEGAIAIDGWSKGQTLEKEQATDKQSMANFFEKAGYVTKRINPPSNTPDKLKAALEALKDKTNIVIYITAHGGVDAKSNPYVLLGGKKLTEAQLCQWLTSYPSTGFKVILQCCHSGSWLASLKDVPNVVSVMTAGGVCETVGSANPDWSWDKNPKDEGLEFTSGLVEDLYEAVGKDPNVDTLELMRTAFETAVEKDECANNKDPKKRTHPNLWQRGDVLFIFDTSGSMGAKDGRALTRLDLARNNFQLPLANARKYAGPAGQFAALLFGEKNPNCKDPRVAVPWGIANDAQVKAITDLLKDLTPQDKTPLAHALNIAFDELRNRPNPAFVLVTDGLETCHALGQAAADDAAAKFGLNPPQGLPRFMSESKFVIFFVPTVQPAPGTALEKALNDLLKSLDNLGRQMQAKMIALVNSAKGFAAALEGAVVEALNPAPNGLGRLHAARNVGDSVRVSVYVNDSRSLDSNNNGDGVIDPNETIALAFRIGNVSDAALDNLALVNMRTANPDHALPKLIVGNVGKDAEAFTGVDAVKITVPNNVKAGSRLTLSLEIEANGQKVTAQPLQFLFTVGSLLTPTEYQAPQPVTTTPLTIAFAPSQQGEPLSPEILRVHLTQGAVQEVKILVSGPKDHGFGLFSDVQLGASPLPDCGASDDLHLDLENARAMSPEYFEAFPPSGIAEVTCQVTSEIGPPGKIYLQAFSYKGAIDCPDEAHISNVLTIKVIAEGD
jgi:peptide/nickel transport system substrate-binding protein